MEYQINITITNQALNVERIATVEGTVKIVRCNFDFDNTWATFPARQAIFRSSAQYDNYVASIVDDTCIIPHEVLDKAGSVSVAIVGTNADGQVQRTIPATCVIQTSTLKGGVNSIDPTPDQYAQFIAQVEEIIGDAGVFSVNGKTGDVTLTASDVGALADTVTVPTRTSQLTNDSGFLSSIPAEYVTETELNGALATKANTADLATVATSGSYNDLTNKPTIPTVPVQSVNGKTGAVVLTASDVNALPSSTAIPSKTSDLQNDSGFLTSAVTSFNGNTGAVTYTAPVTSVNGSTGAVVIGNATTSAAGLMSATDKQHLEAVYTDYSSAITALGA